MELSLLLENVLCPVIAFGLQSKICTECKSCVCIAQLVITWSTFQSLNTAVVILLYVHHIRDSYIFVAEVTGQNFIDEDSEGEKANHVAKAKRRKTNNGLTSSNDQVMVLGKHYACRKFLELPFLLGKRQRKR